MDFFTRTCNSSGLGDAGRFAVHEKEFDLSVGEALRVGDWFVTVVDIDGTDVSFRIDDRFDDDSALDDVERSILPR